MLQLLHEAVSVLYRRQDKSSQKSTLSLQIKSVGVENLIKLLMSFSDMKNVKYSDSLRFYINVMSLGWAYEYGP